MKGCWAGLDQASSPRTRLALHLVRRWGPCSEVLHVVCAATSMASIPSLFGAGSLCLLTRGAAIDGARARARVRRTAGRQAGSNRVPVARAHTRERARGGRLAGGALFGNRGRALSVRVSSRRKDRRGGRGALCCAVLGTPSAPGVRAAARTVNKPGGAGGRLSARRTPTSFHHAFFSR